MGEQRCFFRNAAEWDAIAERLKLTPCPHCQVVGMLIRHGCLYGFDENNHRRKTLRARRIFCSNRQARRGCGRTFSVWCADKVRRLSLTAAGLWRFLLHAVRSSLRDAIHAANCHLSDRSMQRIWKRFDQSQSNIRTALFTQCPPPQLPAHPAPTHPARRTAAHALAHLQAAFPDCPIATFQHTLRTFFI